MKTALKSTHFLKRISQALIQVEAVHVIGNV